MRILVTGGSGFLGRTIVRDLTRRGHRVRVCARNSPEGAAAACCADAEFVRGDIVDTDFARRVCAGMEAVIHTAAKAGVWGAAAEYHRINVVGTRNIVDGCRAAGVAFLVHTSTPSVVYTGGSLSGVDERAPLVRACPCAYPLSKAEAERLALEASGASLRVVALRPHLIWGEGDPHLVPRVVWQAQNGRLRIIGSGTNRVDLTHVENAALAHRLALEALASNPDAVSGRAYFVSDGAPVRLWDWINDLLSRLGIQPVRRRVPRGIARLAGATCEVLWKCLPLAGEPPMTRFVSDELAHDHWFDISAARRDLRYAPVAGGPADFEALAAWLRRECLTSGKA